MHKYLFKSHAITEPNSKLTEDNHYKNLMDYGIKNRTHLAFPPALAPALHNHR